MHACWVARVNAPCPKQTGHLFTQLKVCRWLAATAIRNSASVCLLLFLTLCPIFQPRMLACATSSQGFGPLTGRLWGIRRVRTEEDEGERGTSQRGALQGSSRLPVLAH